MGELTPKNLTGPTLAHAWAKMDDALRMGAYGITLNIRTFAYEWWCDFLVRLGALWLIGLFFF